MLAVKQLKDGWRLALCDYGPPFIQEDEGIMAECVQRDWRALEFASEKLKGNQKLVLNAVKQTWRAMEFASEVEMPAMFEAVKQDWRSIERFLQGPHSDADLTKLVDANPEVIRAPELRNCKPAVLCAVRLHGTALRHATPAMQ